MLRERLDAVLDRLLGRRPPPIVEEASMPFVSKEPVSTYGCLDTGEEWEYPPEDSVIKFLRER